MDTASPATWPESLVSLAMKTVLLSLVLLSLVAPPTIVAGKTARPNILFLLADDLGWGDLACYGAKDIRTPRLDELARQGIRFTQCYANGPECTPTRTALLTGRYQQRVGGLECAIGTGNVGRYDDAIRLAATHNLGLPTSEETLSRLLKSAGYATALAGKWHLGYDHPFAPGGHGFDHAFYCVGGEMDYFHHVERPPEAWPVLRLDGLPVQRTGYFTDLIAEDAIAWLKQCAREPEKPFFLYVPFTAPHSPYQAPDEAQPAPLPADSSRWSQSKGPPEVYAAMIERMDHAAGCILDALAALRVAENTLVVFTSDNGGTKSARPCGLRGIKGTTFEGGIRVPCIIRWPGRFQPGTEYPHPSATFDLTATMAKAAGVLPARPFDGVDLFPCILAGQAPQRDLFWRGKRGDRTWRAAREGNLKYVSETDGAQQDEFLFDLSTDPGEQSNLVEAQAPDVLRLKAKLSTWEREVKPAR